MVVITGDLVESPVESLVKAVEPLSQIKSTYGTYFSTGEWSVWAKGCGGFGCRAQNRLAPNFQGGRGEPE